MRCKSKNNIERFRVKYQSAPQLLQEEIFYPALKIGITWETLSSILSNPESWHLQ